MSRFLIPLFSVCFLCAGIGAARGEVTYEQLNAAFHIPLWTDDSLWDDDVSATSRRLGWPVESLTSTESSFREYPKSDQRILGARPYTAALYGSEGKVAQISMVFANKGDFGNLSQIQDAQAGAVGGQRVKLRKLEREAIQGLPRAIKDDADAIGATLTRLLGEPGRERVGEGRSLSEQAYRWDWKGHSVLLIAKPDEYVAVRVQPASSSTDNGSATRTRDADFKALLKKRVLHRDNGDVIITEIPMVDQGPKGYCVPATMERYLRYVQIPADMYVLAMAGETTAGGGTSISGICNAVADVVRAHGRSLERMSPSLRVTNIARSIDDGVPILWAMYVDEALNKSLTMRVPQRAGTSDPEVWKQALKAWRKAGGKIRPEKENAHVCLIIGYNKNTDELAISDSWGPQYAERWIAVDEAEAISQNGLYVIKW